MTSEEVSPGKSEATKRTDHYQEKIINLERDLAQNGIELCMTLAQAEAELGTKIVKSLCKSLKWRPAKRTKHLSAGKFLLKLSDELRDLMPPHPNTIYLIASASAELRDKAIEEGVLTKELTRDRWDEYVEKNRPKHERPKTILRIYRRGDETEVAPLLESVKRLAEEHSAEIEVPQEKPRKGRGVKNQIIALAQEDPTMSVKTLIERLGLNPSQ